MLEELMPLINEKNSAFSKKLIPGAKPCMGAYTADLKKIAKRFIDENKLDFLNHKHQYHEEDMIHVFMLTYLKDIDLVYKLVDEVVPNISNWAMCDQLICNLRIVKKNKERFISLLDKYKCSNKEYEVRFVLIMLLAHYCEHKYSDYIIDVINNCYKDAYFIKMAIAWLLCDMMIKLKDETMLAFDSLNIDDWTYNKAIQKMIESRRIDQEDKNILRLKKRR